MRYSMKFLLNIFVILFITSLLNQRSSAADAIELKIPKLEMLFEAYNSAGSHLKGTENNKNEMSNRVAVRSGFHKVEFFEKHCPPERLTDGKVDYNGSVISHFWSAQGKRLRITIDMESLVEIQRVEVWQLGGCGLIESIEVRGALEKNCWGTPLVQKQKQMKKTYSYPITFLFGKVLRYLEIVCQTTQGPTFAVAEVKVFGCANEKEKAVPQWMIPPETWRIEAEQIQAAVTPDVGSPFCLNRKYIWLLERNTPLELEIEIPLKNKIFYSWVRHSGKPFRFKVGKKEIYIAERKNWGWSRGASIAEQRFRIELKSPYGADSCIDSILFTTNSKLNPNTFNDLMFLERIPELSSVSEFAQALLATKPDILPEEFAEKVASHYGYPPMVPRRVIDENNALLVNGKPFFPLGGFHVTPDEPKLVGTKFNTFISTAPNRDNWRSASHMAIKTLWSNPKAYDYFAKEFMKLPADRVALIYLCDEPDAWPNLDMAHHKRVDALCKRLLPNVGTFNNFVPGSRMISLFKVTDIVSLDQYPIPNGRIADIAYCMDKMRYFSGNKPVIFIPQSFAWPGKRYPTPDEVSAMPMVALVHSARGLLWYEFPTGKNSLLSDTHPELWKRLCDLVETLDSIQDTLVGPEIVQPFAVKNGNDKRPFQFRLIVNAARTHAFLLCVNPWDSPGSATLDFTKGVLSDAKVKLRHTYGPLHLTVSGTKLVFESGPFGSGVFELNSKHLIQLRKLSHEEILADLEKKVQMPSGNNSIELTKNKKVDLLDSWRSMNRPESASVFTDEQGLLIECILRFPAGMKSHCIQRDEYIWNDITLELFFGRPGKLTYTQLGVNTLNTHTDITYDPKAEGKRQADASRDFRWSSEIVFLENERAHFRVKIPWESLYEMTGAKPGEAISFNLASSCGGMAQLDWCGVSGSGFHNPLRFGFIVFKK